MLQNRDCTDRVATWVARECFNLGGNRVLQPKLQCNVATEVAMQCCNQGCNAMLQLMLLQHRVQLIKSTTLPLVATNGKWFCWLIFFFNCNLEFYES